MSNTPYLSIYKDKQIIKNICYPNYDINEFKSRIYEMKKLGIKALFFEGQQITNNFFVIGKGSFGIVVSAYNGKKKIALKIKRTDIQNVLMNHEACMLKIANSVNVGPKLLGYTNNLLAMEYIEGTFLKQWLKTLKERKKNKLKKVLRNILEQCWRLDEINLDHGELSHAPKHILIDEKIRAWILDFEASSINRRTSNVTSICNYLFIKSEVAEIIKNKFKIEKDYLIASLRAYKKNQIRINFKKILKVIF